MKKIILIVLIVSSVIILSLGTYLHSIDHPIAQNVVTPQTVPATPQTGYIVYHHPNGSNTTVTAAFGVIPPTGCITQSKYIPPPWYASLWPEA
ncbi:hypothetical protein [Sulfuracidifex tepidarius]|nr:hypothetical protein [Sulfuracidifex tepidarius]